MPRLAILKTTGLVIFLATCLGMFTSCSRALVNQVLESSSENLPTAPYGLFATPTSPTTNTTPIISGYTDPNLPVRIHSASNCGGSLLASGTSDGTGLFALTTIALSENTYYMTAKVTDLEGRTNCSKSPLVHSVDLTGPSITLSSPSSSLANSSASVSFSGTYSDADSISLVAGDVSLTTTGGASCSKSTSVSGPTTFTISLTNCTGDGTVGVSVDTGTALDTAGNAAQASPASATFNVDNTGVSSGTISPSDGDYSTLPTSITWTFPEPVDAASITTADFTVGGTCAGVTVSSVSSAGTTATTTLSGVGGCALLETVSVTADLTGIEDVAGNTGSGTAVANFRFNNVGPTSATFTPPDSDVNPIPSSIDVIFNLTVNAGTVSAADFSLGGTCAGVSISGVSTSGATSTVSLAGTSGCADSETVTLTVDFSAIEDLIGNLGSGTDMLTLTKDAIGPTVALSVSSATVSVLPTSFTATFDSDTDMGTVSSADVVLSGTCSSASLGAVNVASNIATINLNGTASCLNNETLVVGINNTGVFDEAGNAGVGSTTETLTLDTQGPAVSHSVGTSTVGTLPVSIDATFSSDTDMSTVTSGDFSLTGTCGGASISSVTKSSNVATVNLGGTGGCAHSETIILTSDLTGVDDVVGNAGVGSTISTITLDTNGPTAVFGTTTGDYNPLPTSVEVTLDSDTDMSSVTSGDFSLSGTCGTASISSISNLLNVVTVNLAGTGTCVNGTTVILTLDLTQIADDVGNAGVGTTDSTYTFDNVGPSASLSVATGSFNPLPTSVDVTFSADTDMSTVTIADFSLTGTCLTDSISSVVNAGQVATVTLSGTAGCASLSTSILNVALTAVDDLVGNSGIGSQIATYTFDNVAPAIGLSISAGTYNPLPTSIDVTFSVDTDMSTVNIGNFILTGTCLGASISSVVEVGNVATVNLSGTGGCILASTLILTTSLVGVSDLIGNVAVGVQAAVYIRGL